LDANHIYVDWTFLFSTAIFSLFGSDVAKSAKTDFFYLLKTCFKSTETV